MSRGSRPSSHVPRAQRVRGLCFEKCLSLSRSVQYCKICCQSGALHPGGSSCPSSYHLLAGKGKLPEDPRKQEISLSLTLSLSPRERECAAAAKIRTLLGVKVVSY